MRMHLRIIEHGFPRNRGECLKTLEPRQGGSICEHLRCSHNIIGAMARELGERRATKFVDEIERSEVPAHSCVLDVADLGGIADREISKILGLQRVAVATAGRTGEKKLGRSRVIAECAGKPRHLSGLEGDSSELTSRKRAAFSALLKARALLEKSQWSFGF